MKKILSFLALFAMCAVAMAQTPRGDVNGDGSVTSYDITALYNYLLNNDMTYYSASDINGDGEVTAADVTAVYDILLGDNPSVGGHEYVDLGLPSGTLWATMNIGASSPEDYGDYFAWGETAPKDVYNWSTYKWCKWCMGSEYSEYKMTKYCYDSSYGYNGFTDGKTELDPEDDAATANWGAMWRMPSLKQFRELMEYCTTEWTTRNGVKGRLFTSNINGASVFLPAAGVRWDSSLSNVGSWGYYCSRTLYSFRQYHAYVLWIYSGSVFYSVRYRYYGFTVRAVRVSQN